MKKQVLGIALLTLCVITALLARFIGFELDISYIVIGAIGVCLFLYGSIQKRQNMTCKPSGSDKTNDAS